MEEKKATKEVILRSAIGMVEQEGCTVEDRVKEILARAMNGEISFKEANKIIVSFYKKISLDCLKIYLSSLFNKETFFIYTLYCLLLYYHYMLNRKLDKI